jgi:predicted NAD-dependent protein-ADP-ribosyltransferase YbiA (DUF1768 family)
MRVIKFYKVKESFGCFSNFATYPIEVDGVVWPTSEHYFQAQKRQRISESIREGYAVFLKPCYRAGGH